MTPVLLKGADRDTLSHSLGTQGQDWSKAASWGTKDGWPSPEARNMEHTHTHTQRSSSSAHTSTDLDFAASRSAVSEIPAVEAMESQCLVKAALVN